MHMMPPSMVILLVEVDDVAAQARDVVDVSENAVVTDEALEDDGTAPLDLDDEAI
jgi:hypothetical protein